MPTIIKNLSNEDYHHGKQWREYVSSSQLKHYLRSPKAFHYTLDNPTAQTDAMKFGSLFHGLMECLAMHKGDYSMAHDKWIKNVISFLPPVNEKTGLPYGATTKAYADAYQQFLADNEKKTIASAQDVTLVIQMIQSLLNNCGTTSKQVKKLLKWAKESEASYFYEDESGVKLKIRPDMLTSNKVVDWKTCNLDSLDEDSIARQIIKYGYHISLSMYQYVLHEMTGKWYKPYLVFVSKTPPYDSVICDISNWCYYFTNDDDPIVGMGVGAQEFRRLLDLHTECVRINEWPGIESTIKTGDKIMELSVPWWYEKKYFEE